MLLINWWSSVRRAELKKRLQAWKEQPRDELGRFASKAASSPTVRDALVNAGGAVGAIAGARLAGPAGALAGDAVGALAARQVIRVTEATLSASGKKRRERRLQSASKVNRLKGLAKLALEEYKGREDELKSELTEDMLGWLIGNGSAMGINALIPGLSAIPLKGVAPTMLTAPKLTKAINRWRRKHEKNSS